MSVTELLGIEDEVLRELVESRWDSWLEVMPALAVVAEPRHLLKWRVTASPEAANAALVGLAQLAAADGLDDRDAALVLAWLLLPAALRVRRELGWIPGPVDQALAAALWVEVRTVPWQLRSGSRRASCGAFATPCVRTSTFPFGGTFLTFPWRYSQNGTFLQFQMSRPASLSQCSIGRSSPR